MDRDDEPVKKSRLDYWQDLATRLVVLGVTWLVVIGLGLLIPASTRPGVGAFLSVIEQNWTAVTLLLIVLFYKPIRFFIENIDEAFGMKVRKKHAEQMSQTTEPSHGASESGGPSATGGS